MDKKVEDMCKICEVDQGKYCCPKCSILYCSLECYRSEKHLSCSEDFYKTNVVEELSLIENGCDSEMKMKEILMNLHTDDECNYPYESSEDDLDSDDDVNSLSLSERFANVDLNSPDEIIKKLTKEELNDFLKLYKSPDAVNLVSKWKPWWSYYSNSKVEEPFRRDECPNVESIEHLKGICKKEPEVSVRYNLYNILAGYCLTVRFSNGEYMDFPKETASLIGKISLSLKHHQMFSELKSSLESVKEECEKLEWMEGNESNFIVMENDVKNILRGPNKFEEKFYVLAAFCELRTLLTKCVTKSSGKSDRTMSIFPEIEIESTHTFKLFLRRIEFFISLIQNFRIM